MNITDATIERYSPVKLQYVSRDSVRGWALEFQLLPTPEIIFRGDEPTTEELNECLGSTDAPEWFADVCKVVIACRKR